MIAIADMSCAAPSVEQLHAQFLEILPRIETHAQIRFRYLRCPGMRADAIAEVVAVCWKWFRRLVEQGKDVNDFVTTLADFAVRHVRNGRRLCGQEPARDVFSCRAQRLNGFRVETLACSTRFDPAVLYSDPHRQEQIDAFEERLRDNSLSPVPDQAWFRVDFPAWLARLGRRNRAIIESMALDYRTQELAHMHRVSPGRISQLRREFQLDWMRFHKEEV
jgi:hypothetical protein